MRAKQNAKSRALGLILLGLCLFYFLCALGIFILPYDVLARSSLARDFVEFVLQIYPAVERAFSHTDFTQKAAFYIAYMGIVKVVTLVGFAICLMTNATSKTGMSEKMRKEGAVKKISVSAFGVLMAALLAYWDFNGSYIGHRRPKGSPEFDWVLTAPGELFWQMTIDFMFVIFVAACIFYVSLQIWLLFRKRKGA